jgi:O-antigen/teichoic acid export membrane protein
MKKAFVLKQSEFVRNSITLIAGTSVAQLLPIAAMPVISRLYRPEDYGVSGVFLSFVTLVTLLSTMQYSSAIIVPDTEDEAIELMYLGFALCIGWTMLTLGLVLFADSPLALRVLKSADVGAWLKFAPLAIFAGGVANTLSVYCNRRKAYRRLSASRIASAAVGLAVTIAIGVWHKGPLGLILAVLVSQVLPAVLLSHWLLRHGGPECRRRPPAARLLAVARKYKHFPLFSLPSDFINSFINQLPVFLLSSFAGAVEVGHYNVANRLLGLPISFISGSVSEVFKQKAAEDYTREGTSRRIFVRTFTALAAMAVVPFLLLVAFAPSALAFALGESWREAGQYCRILGVLFFLRFTVSPLTVMYVIAQRLREDFVLHLYMLGSTALAMYAAHRWFTDHRAMVIAYAVNYSAIYLLYFARSFQFTKGRGVPSVVPSAS